MVIHQKCMKLMPRDDDEEEGICLVSEISSSQSINKKYHGENEILMRFSENMKNCVL